MEKHHSMAIRYFPSKSGVNMEAGNDKNSL